ncbi:MAG: hypothetical protein V1670_03190 [Candidatus Omnitrophota bacterium]
MSRACKGQSILEYAMIIAVVVAGLLAMNTYMRRGVEGKLRESTDNIGEQYEAGETTSNYTTTQVGAHVTHEVFGITQGDSNYSVTTPGVVTRSATGVDAETVSSQLRNDTLF